MSPVFCLLSSVHNHQALAVGFSVFIHVNSAGCLFYNFNCLGYLVQLWDLEYFAALSAVYSSVGCTAIKQPGTDTFRALGDNLHRYIPYTNSRILRAYPNNPLYCGWLQSPMPALSAQNVLNVEKTTPPSIFGLPPWPRTPP